MAVPLITFEDMWPLEQSLWLGGLEEYEALLHPQCMMAFAQIGVLDAEAIKATVQGQRWRSIQPTDASVSIVDRDLVVIGYRAEAERDGEARYRCVCTSTYTHTNGRWLLLQHQQSLET